MTQVKPTKLVCFVLIAFSVTSVQSKALNAINFPQSALTDGQVATNVASSETSTNGLNSQSAMYGNQADENEVKNTKDKKADYSYGHWSGWHQYPAYPWNYGNCPSCPYPSYPYPYPYPYPHPQQHVVHQPGHYQYPYNNYPYWYHGGSNWWYPYNTQAVQDDNHSKAADNDGGEKKNDEKKAKTSQ